jgi:multicomponent Na+:H+ antiporter subunit F
MIAMELTLIDLAARFGLIVLTIGMMLSVYRIVRGPERADRIVALDLLSILVTALIVLYAIYSGQTAFMDVAIAYALVAFLGTVAFARFLERTPSKTRRPADACEPPNQLQTQEEARD